MKNPAISRFSRPLLMLSAALTGTAAAHPGGHADQATTLEGLRHFFTHLDHVGPVIAVLLLAVFAFRRRVAIAAALVGWRGKTRNKREP
jgi:hydrogenase/urease accessory protein HupE